MNILSKIIKSKYFFLYLLAAFNLLVAYFYVKQPFQNYSDSYVYYDALKYLQGAETSGRSLIFNMILRAPLMLYLTLFFNYFVGSFSWSMMTINIIFYILAIYFFYQLVLEIYRDHKTAALSSILFFSNYNMFSYGTAFLIDMGGWFFFILSSFFAIKYFNNNLEKKYYFLSVISSLTGVFFKETGALGLITLGMVILLSDFALKKKIKEIFFAVGIFSIPLVSYHLWFYFNFDLTYFYWFGRDLKTAASESAAGGNPVFYALVHMVKVLGWLYSVGWLIFIFGLWQEKKSFIIQRGKILMAMLPASLTFLAWPQLVQRVAFTFVPWLVLISGFGLSKIKNKLLIAVILAVYLLINFWAARHLIPNR